MTLLTNSAAWQALKKHQQEITNVHSKDFFLADSGIVPSLDILEMLSTKKANRLKQAFEELNNVNMLA